MDNYFSFGDTEVEAPFSSSGALPGYFSQNAFHDSNADLNSFFSSGTGLTPLQTPGLGQYRASSGLANFPWEDNHNIDFGGNVYSKQEPEPTLDPIITGGIAEATTQNESMSDDLFPQLEPETVEDSSKPKRGRPRKKREKKQLTAEEENAKRQKFLERNRLAASKCRDRKKNWTIDTQERLAREEKRHLDLQLEFAQLQGEVSNLMEAACQHVGKCEKGDGFQEILVQASERFAAIGRMYSDRMELNLGLNHAHGPEEEFDDADDVDTPTSDEPPHKRMRNDEHRSSSIDDSITSLDDNAGISNRDLRALKRQPVAPQQQAQQQRLPEHSTAQSSAMSRQNSNNSSNSSGPPDSGISAMGSPVKSKFQGPFDEGYSATNEVLMMPNPRIYQGSTAHLDALLYAKNLASGVFTTNAR